MTFAELSLMSSMEHNRSLKLMEKINDVIDWSKIEILLMKHYTVGTSKEGADAYPPLMLLNESNRRRHYGEGYKVNKIDRLWERAKQENLKTALHCRAVLRDKPPEYRRIPGEIPSAYEEYY